MDSRRYHSYSQKNYQYQQPQYLQINQSYSFNRKLDLNRQSQVIRQFNYQFQNISSSSLYQEEQNRNEKDDNADNSKSSGSKFNDTIDKISAMDSKISNILQRNQLIKEKYNKLNIQQNKVIPSNRQLDSSKQTLNDSNKVMSNTKQNQINNQDDKPIYQDNPRIIYENLKNQINQIESITNEVEFRSLMQLIRQSLDKLDDQNTRDGMNKSQIQELLQIQKAFNLKDFESSSFNRSDTDRSEFDVKVQSVYVQTPVKIKDELSNQNGAKSVNEYQNSSQFIKQLSNTSQMDSQLVKQLSGISAIYPDYIVQQIQQPYLKTQSNQGQDLKIEDLNTNSYNNYINQKYHQPQQFEASYETIPTIPQEQYQVEIKQKNQPQQQQLEYIPQQLIEKNIENRLKSPQQLEQKIDKFRSQLLEFNTDNESSYERIEQKTENVPSQQINEQLLDNLPQSNQKQNQFNEKNSQQIQLSHINEVRTEDSKSFENQHSINFIEEDKNKNESLELTNIDNKIQSSQEIYSKTIDQQIINQVNELQNSLNDSIEQLSNFENKDNQEQLKSRFVQKQPEQKEHTNDKQDEKQSNQQNKTSGNQKLFVFLLIVIILFGYSSFYFLNGVDFETYEEDDY